ncbi:iron complex transport system permease protein [Microbacterium halimionae]|uniref:Iron complex transport system permease protein n=1 Tax=Microbacterium halimionae TaxID=1526413 RepID=A0A7W3JL91_9MICO|nr:iron ABC transporter permease [Microbacterium halimionae]MBA8814967.1 iron complex transport system permease protein [Microbacterium halimionae]NII94242.1 iron complex transport system permease protein [Microbacterium halimionae]
MTGQAKTAAKTAAKSAATSAATVVFRRGAVVALASVFLVAGVVLSAGLGQLSIAPTEVVGSVLRSLGLDNGWAPTGELIEKTLWQIRFPRIVMALLVGGLLAIAGAIMQAIFGNPLAEPGVVGVSSGAAVGAAASIALGLTFFGTWTTAVFAFAGGLAATFIVYSTAKANGRTESVTLILTGIAVNAFTGAALAILMFAGGSSAREQIVFWQLGSINGSRWTEVGVVAALGTVSTVIALGFARQFDLLALGDRTASHLGVRVERLRVVSIVVVALMTGVAVAFVGIIAFVGLVVPHLVRMALGPANRWVMIVSLLGGATLLVYADLLARTLVPSADLPIGILTSLIGGPFFYWLIRRGRRSGGGWA